MPANSRFASLVFMFALASIASSQDANPSPPELTTKITLGKCVDPAGNPVAGAMILTAAQTSFSERFKKVLADESGTFRMTFPVSKKAFFGGHLWAWSEGYRLKCVQNMNRKIHRIELIPDQGESIQMTVLAPDGSPLPNVIVQPYGYEMPNGVYESEKVTGLSGYLPDAISTGLSVETNADGVARIHGCSPTLLRSIRVVSKKYGEQIFSSRLVNVQLKKPGSLKVVLENYDKAPEFARNLSVNTMGDNVKSIGNASFDKNGICEFEHLVPGSLDLYLNDDYESKVRYKLPPRNQQIQAGETIELRLPLVETTIVEGRILAGNEGVANARISVRSSNGRQVIVSNEDGSFAARVFAGEVRLQVFVLPGTIQQNYKYPPSKKIQADLNAENVVQFSLPQQEKVEGKIVDRDGVPLTRGFVAVIQTKPFGFPAFTAQINDDGSFVGVLRDNDWKRRADNEFDVRVFESSREFRGGEREKAPVAKIVSRDPLVIQLAK